MNFDANEKISLPKYLQLFTLNGVPMHKAMTIASKVYKDYNTPGTLALLSDPILSTLGLQGEDERNMVISSLRKAGYISKGVTRKVLKITSAADVSLPNTLSTPPSVSAGSPAIHTGTPRKRKRSPVPNEFLARESRDDASTPNNQFEFNAICDEEVLSTKYVVINRAPMMMGWSMLVAECMGFSREESLSIASVYTELNAIRKDTSLGIYSKIEGHVREATVGGSQPYVDLMGRRIPLYRTKAGEWRGLSNGKPVPPTDAFTYITRSFKQTTPYVIGALMLLAKSYSAEELNVKAWGLYADFRPDVNEWGKRSTVYFKKILDLRKTTKSVESKPASVAKGDAHAKAEKLLEINASDESISKRQKLLSVEEYEAILDQDDSFNDADLDFTEDPVRSAASP